MSRRGLHRLLAWNKVLGAVLAGAFACTTGAATLGAIPGCSTPSVPLPPPEVDLRYLAFSMPEPDKIVLTGMPRETHRNVRFFVINDATGDGIITTTAADGSFSTMPFAAKEGDVARLYFETPEGDMSLVVCVTILVAQPLVGANCQ